MSADVVAAPAGPLSPESIKAMVATALRRDTEIPTGHRGAVVTVVNLDKVEVALATKVKEHWTVELVASHAWTGDNVVGVLNTVTW